jgi:hypothetical protein
MVVIVTLAPPDPLRFIFSATRRASPLAHDIHMTKRWSGGGQLFSFPLCFAGMFEASVGNEVILCKFKDPPTGF